MANDIENFENQKRSKMVGVKLTPEEYDDCKEHCEELGGISLSRYFRYLYTQDKNKRKR